ncbi:MAG: hypothetical protein E7049_05965 [Lentisphaerae bacterium]|jgi:hypothetical protein|nr:hypothetical protein [Lentisphaerota bacterium]
MKKIALLVALALASGALLARPHGGPHHAPPRYHHSHHHHHHGGGFAAGVIGGAILGGLVYDAIRPAPVIVNPAPVVATPAPVVVQQPVVVQPAPVVVQQPVYETRSVWVEGRYVDQAQPNGTVIRVWQPGHYEQRQVQVGVQSVYQ